MSSISTGAHGEKNFEKMEEYLSSSCPVFAMESAQDSATMSTSLPAHNAPTRNEFVTGEKRKVDFRPQLASGNVELVK